MSLRQDEKQWMIYQEDSVKPAIDAVKSLLMALGAEALKSNPDLVLRAFGTFGEQVTDTHLRYWNGGYSEKPDGRYLVAGEHLARIYAWLSDEGERPDQALDELHAAVVWLNKRAKDAGVSGPGWYRDAVKEVSV